MRFFTSDTHFGHANIIAYCDRPFANYEEMDEALIANWNSVVSDGDTVYHLGDVAMGPNDRWDGILTRLNGYKILVEGNHDRIFEGAYDAKTIAKFMPRYESWFDEIYSSSDVNFVPVSNGAGNYSFKYSALLSHYPYEADHMETRRYMEYRLPDEGHVLIHGHTHSKEVISYSEKGTLQIHVGMDANNFTPVSEDQIVALMDSLL